MLDWEPAADREAELSRILHPPIAVSPTKQVDEMLDFFEEREARAALVVNEFGSVDGVVTLSDVTNFLFSGLFESAAAPQARVVPVGNGFEMDGNTSVAVARRLTRLDLRDSLMTTIGGLTLRQFGYVPAVGDRVQFDGLMIEVLEMDGLRVSRIRLSRAETKQRVSGEQTHD